VLLRDFNAHGKDAGVCEDAIGQYDDANLYDNEKLLLQQCAVYRDNFFATQEFTQEHLV